MIKDINKNDIEELLSEFTDKGIFDGKEIKADAYALRDKVFDYIQETVNIISDDHLGRLKDDLIHEVESAVEKLQEELFIK